MKNIAVITDLSSVGRCSSTVALPIISALSNNCVIVPTSILSAQTGFDNYSILDNNQLDNFLTDVDRNIDIDIVVVGFLTGAEQANTVSKHISNTNAMVIFDPIMADNGRLYGIYDYNYVQAVRSAIKGSDIALPNLTEACLLMGIDYDKLTSLCGESNYFDIVRDKLSDICQVLGVNRAIITGIVTESEVCNLVIDSSGSQYIVNHRIGGSYSGTGDIFSSIVAGSIANGLSLVDSVKRASTFVTKAISNTDPLKPTKYGVNFQSALRTLYDD